MASPWSVTINEVLGGGVKVKYNMAWRVPDAVQSPETHGHDDSRQELFGKHINAAHKCGHAICDVYNCF